MRYSVTIMTVETITTARATHNRKRDAHLTDAAPVIKTIRTPIFETTVDADNMTDARNRARAIMAPIAAPRALPCMFAVNIDAAAAPVDCAVVIAHKVLKHAYSVQCLQFILDALQSIDRVLAIAATARRAINDVDLSTLDCNAADVVSVASLAMLDARAADAAAMNYAVCRAAYRACNEYVRAARARAVTTARQDINTYLRISDARADIDAAAAYDAGYYIPAADADAAAIDRAAYLDARRNNRHVIRAALDCMTPKQRRAITTYAACNSMRATAAAIGVKNQSTVARHIAAARAAIDRAAPVDVAAYVAADAAAAQRNKIVIADADARAAIDVASAAADVTAATVDARRNRAAYDAATARRAAIDARRAAVDAARAAINADADYTTIDAAIIAARAARARAAVADVAAAELTAIDAAAARIDRRAAAIDADAAARIDRARAAYAAAIDRARRIRDAQRREIGRASCRERV